MALPRISGSDDNDFAAVSAGLCAAGESQADPSARYLDVDGIATLDLIRRHQQRRDDELTGRQRPRRLFAANRTGIGKRRRGEWKAPSRLLHNLPRLNRLPRRDRIRRLQPYLKSQNPYLGPNRHTAVRPIADPAAPNHGAVARRRGRANEIGDREFKLPFGNRIFAEFDNFHLRSGAEGAFECRTKRGFVQQLGRALETEWRKTVRGNAMASRESRQERHVQSTLSAGDGRKCHGKVSGESRKPRVGPGQVASGNALTFHRRTCRRTARQYQEEYKPPHASLPEVVHLLVHLVRRLYDLRVRLVSALGDDHVDKLFNDVHV